MRLSVISRIIKATEALIVIDITRKPNSIITPPAVGEAFLVFFSVSKVGLPLMGDTAGTKFREPIETRRLTAEYVNKTYILTCILQYLQYRKKVLRAKTLMQNVL